MATTVSSDRLTEQLKETNHAATADVPTTTVQIPKGRKRITGARSELDKALAKVTAKPSKSKGKAAPKKGTAKTHPASKTAAKPPKADRKPRKSDRSHGYKPKPSDMVDLKPRDSKRYTSAVLAVACPMCGSKKGAPCMSSTDKLTELRSPHKPRITASTGAKK